MNRLMIAAVSLAATLAAPASARDPDQVLMPPPGRDAAHRQWGFAQAVTHGDTVYLSGVVAGMAPGETDPSAGYDRAFRQIADILERAGSSWDEVIEMTTYHTDIPAQIDAFAKVKARYVTAPYPAWTAIDIDRLVPDNGLAEIRVIARKTKK